MKFTVQFTFSYSVYNIDTIGRDEFELSQLTEVIAWTSVVVTHMGSSQTRVDANLHNIYTDRLQ